MTTLIVGGSGGLGSAIAHHIPGPVTLTYARNRDRAEAVAAELGKRATVTPLPLPDGVVHDPESVSSLVFAAGADIGQPYVSQTEPSDLRRVLELEVVGFQSVLRQVLPGLRKSAGSIVVVSSAGLGRWPPGDVLSVAPKAAVQAIVRGIAREEGRHGVRANCVAVGVADAGMFHRIDFDEAWLDAARRNIPLRRFGTADEIASAVAFLASDAASYVTGQTLFVDGGYSV